MITSMDISGHPTVPRRGPVRRLLLGRPMPIERLTDELLPKRIALPVFSSDALSSVAYASEAALAVIVAASLASRGALPWISLAVAALLVIVVASYRQTIAAYPNGGGAYVVARENLGTIPALVAAASLLVDYTLTVAVSVAAGVLAISSVAVALDPYVVTLSLVVLAVLAVANLRGLRESGTAFALPTYVFIASLGVCIAVGVTRGLLSGWPAAHVPSPAPTGTAATLGLVVLLRAFASGCSALTGVEAVANGVGAFRRPQARNAITTITIMGAAAVVLFLGVSLLAWKTDARPSQTVSVLAQVARASFGQGALGDAGFYLLQVSTFAVLILAANTAFQGFPRLAALLARDGFAPRELQNLGDRLVLSNGILVLATAAGVLLALSGAQVDELIHLYLLGVFTAFTLSQAGMVRHWIRRLADGADRRATLPPLALNAVGATATAAVAVIVIATKFTQGAWMVVIAIPILVAIALGVRRHYTAMDVRLAPLDTQHGAHTALRDVIVLVNGADPPPSEAIAYADTISAGRFETLRLVSPGAQATTTAADPERSKDLVVTNGARDALVAYLRDRVTSAEGPVTLILPERFSNPSLLEAVGPRSLFALKLQLSRQAGLVVTSVPHVDGASAPSQDGLVVEVVVPIAALNQPTIRTLAYVGTLHVRRVRAVHVAMGEDGDDELAQRWRRGGLSVPLEIVPSRFRDLGGPLLDIVRSVTADPNAVCNVVIPDPVPTRLHHRLLHGQHAMFIKRLLLFEPRVIVTSFPYSLLAHSRDGESAHEDRRSSQRR